MLRHLATRAGVKDNDIFYGIASEVTYNFGAKQRRLLFEWLNDIEERVPGGLRWRRRQRSRVKVRKR